MENNINIRPMVIEDIEEFIRIRNDAKEYLHNNSEFSVSDAKKWFIDTKPKFFVLEYESKMIGYFRTTNLGNEEIYIGCDISSEYRGKGIGYKSYLIFIKKIRSEYNVKKIKLEVLSNNTRAIHIYEKLGFEKIGLSNTTIIRDGKQIESIIMELK